MKIISVIPDDFGAKICAKKEDGQINTFTWSATYKNIHDPNWLGQWLGNGWETLNDAILHIISL